MMRNEDGRLNERLMSDEAVEDAVLRSLEESLDLDAGPMPERDLWPEIEARIGARVLPLGRESVRARVVRRRPTWLPMAAAAALLVASTSGVTYLLTRHLSAPTTGATPAAQTAANPMTHAADTQQAQVPATDTATASTTVEPQHAVADADRTEKSPVKQAGKETAKTPTHEAVRHDVTPTTQLASYKPSSREDEARAAYDDEIVRLHETLESRRDDLDPATVATVEQNLRVIDNAIHQAKAALAKDPHSRLLNDQLDHTLAKKTELLRAATMLPSA